MKKLPVYEMLIDESDESDLQVDFIALVDKPAIKKDFMKFAEDMPHYTAEGVLWVGPTHKDANGRLMTGAVHSEDSVYLYHEGEFAKIGPRGGINESDKAPKSGTKNNDPQGEGSAKGDASGKRGAKVTAEQEKTLENKVKDFNEKESNTKNGNATLGALKSVFQRGLGAYNTSHSPLVKSAEQWAFARVNAFLYLLKNGRPENDKYTTDYDLLPNDHPKSENFGEMIICKECGHTWEYAEGGEDPYKCHMCNYAFESYSDYPDSVKNNAKAALDYANENGWGSCGTEVGKQRANQLAKGEPISFDTIKRMYSYLSRHEVDLDSSKGYGDGCGKLMYDAWGGKSALSWAESKIKQVERKGFAIQNEEQRIISGPLMVAYQKIPRVDADGFEYEVFFSPATIKKIAIKMAKKGFQNNVNLMHSADMQLSGVTLFEIFQSDKERGIMPMKGFEDLADGSLFGSMYVDNDQAWQLIKDGKVKGFSVEGNFGMKGKDKYDEQMEQIISILSETNFE
jgi:rubrerythrin